VSELPLPSATQLVAPFGGIVQPWVLTAALSGLASAALFCVIAGRGLSSLTIYALLGMTVGPLCVSVLRVKTGAPVPITVGEVDLVVVLVGTWVSLTFARALRL
jgi:hypothetical protein